MLLPSRCRLRALAPRHGPHSPKDPATSVVVLVLFFAAVVFAVGLLVAMATRDKPFYGAMGVCLIAGPGSLLAFLHVALA